MTMRQRLKRFVLPSIFKRLNPHWFQLAYLGNLLRQLDVDCVLDVGANAGQFGHQLRSAGYDGLILSFEPDPTVFRELRRTAEKDELWRAFNMALGSDRGELQLNIMSRSEFNSFRAPTTEESDVVANFNTVVGTERVQVHALSELLPALAAELRFKRAFLKMDTQGFDWEVFSGALGAMDLIVGLQSEISVLRVYEDVPSWSQMIGRYEGAGFELLNLFSVSPGFHKLLEFDCYMIKRGSPDQGGDTASR